MKIVELAEALYSRGDGRDLGRTKSLTSARHRDDLGYIRIWITLLRRLFFGMLPKSFIFELSMFKLSFKLSWDDSSLAPVCS